MDTKLNSRQQQNFPASFPDTFKDFFAMMSDDEEHLELFSNLLEDKVIPKSSNNRFNQRRRCGGSFRLTQTTNNTNLNNNLNVGRSNSFRVNRPNKNVKYCSMQQKHYSQNYLDHYCNENQSITNVGNFLRNNDNNDGDDEENEEDGLVSGKIVQRQFEFENCDDSDTISSTSSASTIPYNTLHQRIIQNKNFFHSKDTLSAKKLPQCGGVRYNAGSQSVISGGKNAPPIRSATSPVCEIGSNLELNCSRTNDILNSKSPILNRRRSSSIVANLLTDNKYIRNPEDTWLQGIPNSNTRERLAHHAKSPVDSLKPSLSNSLKNSMISESGVLTLKQAMSGCMSPFEIKEENDDSNLLTSSNDLNRKYSLTSQHDLLSPTMDNVESLTGFEGQKIQKFNSLRQNQKQRMRTSSMPVESRKPRLADTRRRDAIHCADIDMEYYRLRSFSITSHGICNLGDSLRSRRSRSINSVTSAESRKNSNTSGDVIAEHSKDQSTDQPKIPAYKIAMLGYGGVGKTALTYQFTTSDYICAYDLSLDDDYGQKTVSVLVDGIETDLEIIDHPCHEMSTEAFCSTYNVDLFVIVYSVVDKNTFKAAEKILCYLKENEMLLTRGAILVGNKIDLERHREVTRQMGRKLAKEIECKFIETSSGIDHNVNELLVGIVAQVKLNPQRIRRLSEKDKQRLALQTTIHKHRRMNVPPRKITKQNSICLDVDPPSTTSTTLSSEGVSSIKHQNLIKTGPIRKVSKRVLNLENILNAGESEDDEDGLRRPISHLSPKVLHENTSSEVAGCSSSYESYEKHNQPNLTIEENDSKIFVDCNKKNSSKLSNRTKVFLTSILKFKRNLNVKRRSSSSCSDLFVI